MKITKFGHSCLLIEEQQARILIDPGNYSIEQDTVANLDAILITHEHDDHCYLESVQTLLKNNPQVKIYSNEGVAKKLAAASIPLEVVKNGDTFKVKDVEVEVWGELHAEIHSTLPRIPNTGYFIAGRLLHPGDFFIVSEKQVEILALPVAAPWMRISEGVDYAKIVHPKVCFPIHDAILKIPRNASWLAEKLLPEWGISVVLPEENKAMEF